MKVQKSYKKTNPLSKCILLLIPYKPLKPLNELCISDLFSKSILGCHQVWCYFSNTRINKLVGVWEKNV